MRGNTEVVQETVVALENSPPGVLTDRRRSRGRPRPLAVNKFETMLPKAKGGEGPCD